MHRSSPRRLHALLAASTLAVAACGGTADDESTDTTTAPNAETSNSTASSNADSDFLGSYTLEDEEFGTSVTVTVDRSTRSIESNSLPNHETGEFPNEGNPNTISEQSLSYEFTTTPSYTGDATFAQTPGVGANGVAFEPGTGESVECSTGENYRIEALQDLYDLGLDFNNAHVQPEGQYHYHGVSDLMIDSFATDDDLVHVGFASDGFLIYYSKSGAYSTSYTLGTDDRSGTGCAYRDEMVDLDGTSPDGTYVSDWVYTDGGGDLDECNGTTVDGEYLYVITEQYPYIPRCLNGEYEGVGGGVGGAAPGGPPTGAGAGE